MGVVISASFGEQGVSGYGEPGFAKESDESFPVFVGDLCCFESVKEVTVFLCVVVSLIERLLCNDGGNKSVEFGNVLVDSVGC